MKINTDKFLKTSPLIKPTQTKLKAPFAWVGGKNYLAKEIIALMPEHKSYIEV
ncbi:DNA adenine methylase, partial [Campylobacter jejuni]|nr:DNA adenine methylase [Campylobacter jejuni]EGI1624975.1 DNA adenine methylase [Campylobacter coli]